jgi:predicted NodU family carbamoyl transferase
VFRKLDVPSRSINFPLWLVLLSQAEQLGIEKYDGLVITGGCALNVKANDEVWPIRHRSSLLTAPA